MATKILVVDDEPLICQLLSYQLGGAGYEVTTEKNGSAALARLALVKPDLVLLDVMMPDISGWDICRQIRDYSTVPIIMLTAKCADTDVVTGLNNGADDYIAKPFSLVQLLARIEAVLRRVQPAMRAQRSSVHKPLTLEHRQRASTAAYATPVALAEDAAKRSVDDMTPVPTPTLAVELEVAESVEARPRLGDRLIEARLARGLSLHQAERACGVRWEFLQAVEREQFGFMTRPQLRYTLHNYSAYLGVDLQEFLQRPATPPPKTHHNWALPLGVSVAVVLMMVALIVGLYLF